MATSSSRNTPGGATLPLLANESLNMWPMVPKPRGSPATIPAKISREMPLPMPRSVICSPIHMTNTEPTERVKPHRNLKPKPGMITTSGPRLWAMVATPNPWMKARPTVR